MANSNPILDDLAGLVTGAMGAARSAGEEAKTAVNARVRSAIADMDLAGRDEVEALKLMAVEALDKVEALQERLAAMEEKLNKR